ncbi:MAG: class I SAM-dependent methyltransferase [Actinomycetota bacterium]
MLTFLLKKIANGSKNSRVFKKIYGYLESLFRIFDSRATRLEKNCLMIPSSRLRYGGQRSLTEYVHTIGIFQTLLYIYLKNNENAYILDFGCGTGKLLISCLPFLGRYYGVDTSETDINKCKKNYNIKNCDFYHISALNDLYNIDGAIVSDSIWPVKDESMDAVIACSVFTHLNEKDALFYMDLISKKLKSGGCAILTFFLLDKYYDLNKINETRWKFDLLYPGSDNWYYPSYLKIPESQIGIDEKGIKKLLGDKLFIQKIVNGSWKNNGTGLFFQDIIIFRKK